MQIPLYGLKRGVNVLFFSHRSAERVIATAVFCVVDIDSIEFLLGFQSSVPTLQFLDLSGCAFVKLGFFNISILL